jgi:hypothetical protein
MRRDNTCFNFQLVHSKYVLDPSSINKGFIGQTIWGDQGTLGVLRKVSSNLKQ